MLLLSTLATNHALLYIRFYCTRIVHKSVNSKRRVSGIASRLPRRPREKYSANAK